MDTQNQILLQTVKAQIKAAKETVAHLRQLPASTRKAALLQLAKQIEINQTHILKANQLDISTAQEQQLSPALIDRLALTPERLNSLIKSTEIIANAQDILGEVSALRTQQRGFQLGKMRTPIGLVGMIYESRPNVTIDAAAICIKSGNALILRGGKEALQTNIALAKCIKQALEQSSLPAQSVQFIESTHHQAVNILLTATGEIDVIIPRGGKRLVAAINAQARVPVIKHLEGNCHVYIDAKADSAMAIAIAINAKTYRYGICGAMETLLIHHEKSNCLPDLIHQLNGIGVELRVCEKIYTQFVVAHPALKKATDDDWATEYLAPILAIKMVGSIDEAINHINHYGSQHTDAIVTDSATNQQLFLQCVDSASVMINAPTCFADGFEYGLGAEIGISTDKLHVRGPVGVQGLTTEKYIVLGHGELRN